MLLTEHEVEIRYKDTVRVISSIVWTEFRCNWDNIKFKCRRLYINSNDSRNVPLSLNQKLCLSFYWLIVIQTKHEFMAFNEYIYILK